jgi:diacylglycerol kinase (ATP)
MKRGFLIYNPSAGMTRKTESLISKAVRQFAASGIEMTPYPTEANYGAAAQVAGLLRHGPDLFVAWGGDGTVNEVVNGMSGSRIPIGVICGGTANLFARELGLPRRMDSAIRVISAGRTRLVSVGRANHRLFVLMVGIGFDSHVIQKVNWSLKKKTGVFAFAVAAVQSAARYRFPKFRVRLEEEERECVFAVIAKGREYGAFFHLAPDADISDEFLHVCLFKEPGFCNMVRYAYHAFRRTHLGLQSVEIIKTRTLEITGDPSIPVQADGEIIGCLPMKFDVVPHSVNVFVP